MKEIDVLKYALVDPMTGQVSLMGTYDPAYASGPIAYQDLLADALGNPYPKFSLDYKSAKYVTQQIMRFMDKEMERISRDVDYGSRWMKYDLGIEPEEFRAYLTFDPKSKTLNTVQYRRMGRFLGKLFKSVGVEERFGKAFAAVSKMQKEVRLGAPNFDTTMEVAGLLGITDQIYRIRNDLASNRLSQEAAGRRL